MMNYINEDEYEDFMNEPDTEPFARLDLVQRELDSSESVVAEFTGRAQALGYSVDPPQNWMDRLEQELDGATVPVDSISFLIETP
jgi:hypothetical protein